MSHLRTRRGGARARARGARAALRLALLLALGTTASGAGGGPLPGTPPLPEDLRARLARELASRGPGYEPRTRHREADGAPRFTNRLLLEASPYLQQHAHNPVDWHAWGDEAFETAKRLGRPVLVSIGYSTCHWCHVMEEESFDDVETARLLNEGFVAIKVDREARPDVDAVYMAAIHAMGQPGGWPLNVFVTPDREPFYAGTYFPPEDGPRRPGFATVLRAIRDDWAGDPGKLAGRAGRVAAAIRGNLAAAQATATRIPGPEVLVRASEALAARADPEWGGVGERTKFPSSLPTRMLLRYHRRTGDAGALAMAVLALEKMAAGGLRDHLGGGFHRYATDPRWLVPHFEKMLYDNALLAVAYLEAWQATGRDDFASVTRETLDYLLREMRSPEGGFYSATDADSLAPDGEREEGRFYTWTPAEIEAVLGDGARIVNAWYGVTPAGHVEGRNVLHTWRAPEEVASSLGTTPERVVRAVNAARGHLLRARARRPAPARDEKILAAWNGLAISAFARAGLAFGEPRYAEAARRAAELVLRELRGEDGRLRRVYLAGRADGPAFLGDYAALVAGLLDLYEADPDTRWLREALALQRVQDAHYADTLGGGYFQTADDHETLIAREKPAFDGALPSGNSLAALNLLRLYEFTYDESHRQQAVLLFSAFFELLDERPASLGELLLAVDYHHDSIKEVVVVRVPGDDAARLLAPLRTGFVPNRIVSIVTEGTELERHAQLVPVVAGRRALLGETTAYVCANRVCRMPTSDPEVFAQQLAEAKPLEDPIP